MMNKTFDFGKTLTHAFDDPERVSKVGLGALIMLAPILNFAALGYEVRVIKNVAKGEPRPMPKWDDIGALFMEGLWLGIANLILALPIIVVVFGVMFLYFFGIFSLTFLDLRSDQVERIMSSAGPVILLFGAGLCGSLLVYGLALGFVYPAIRATYARRGTLASCFDFRAHLRFIRDNPGNYLMAWLATLLGGIILQFAVMALYIIPCFGQLLLLPVAGVGSFWLVMVSGHAVGQVMALEEAGSAPSAPLPPPPSSEPPEPASPSATAIGL